MHCKMGLEILYWKKATTKACFQNRLLVKYGGPNDREDIVEGLLLITKNKYCNIIFVEIIASDRAAPICNPET